MPLLTGPAAYEYIRSELDASGKTLSSILKEKNIEQGTIEALVPDSTPKEQLYQFNYGGIYPLPERTKIEGGWISPVINQWKPRIPALIHDYLKRSPENCCIIEVANFSPSDSWTKNSGVEYVYLDEETYYFFNIENFNEEVFARRFAQAGGWYLMCALSSLPIDQHSKFHAFSKITADMLQTLAINTTGFLADAYDGEGYLMWRALPA